MQNELYFTEWLGFNLLNFQGFQKLYTRLTVLSVSQGQNSKAKDEAKARTLKVETEAKAWNIKAKTKDTNVCPRGSSRPRPVLEDYITAMES